MATFAVASAVFPVSIETVWKEVRDFTFPQRLLPSVIESVTLEGTTEVTKVGTIRKMKWRTGEWRRQQLLEVSDINRVVRWELIESDPPSEVEAVISSIRLFRDTERGYTIVEWSSEYSSRVPKELILFDQKSFQQSLNEMREQISGIKNPTLYHLYQGPSTRVLWLAGEIGIPINVEEVTISTPRGHKNLTKSLETERSLGKGGVVTSYKEGNLNILESGAVVAYLLDKHDARNLLIPALNTLERALYHKYFFYSASTADHLIFNAYKEMYVVGEGDHNRELLESFKSQWDEEVSVEFSSQLTKTKFICGDQFTAADIMVGWSLFMANLLGWLEDKPTLSNYLKNLATRPACISAFDYGK